MDRPANWEKVYIYGTRSTTYDAQGKLPDRVQASAYREISRVVSEQGELLGAKTMGNLVN